MATSISNACSIVDALAALQFDLLRRINKKFAALRSLARTLEQLADLQSWIPDLTRLVPVASIDLSLYNYLAASCPYLNLPPADGDLNQLQVAVRNAYTSLYASIRRSPHFRLGQVQDQMDKFQSKLTGSLGQASQFLQCLNAVCAAGEASKLLLAPSQKSLKQAVDTYADNFVRDAGSVLSSTGKAKYAEAVDGLSQLQALGADVKSDYATAKKPRS